MTNDEYVELVKRYEDRHKIAPDNDAKYICTRCGRPQAILILQPYNADKTGGSSYFLCELCYFRDRHLR